MRPPPPDGDGRRIGLTGGLILAVLTLTSGLSIFGVMQGQMKSLLRHTLEDSVKSRAHFYEAQIDLARRHALSVATRPSAVDSLQSLAANPGDAAEKAKLQRIAQAIVETDFSGISFYDARGREAARAGRFTEKFDLSVPLDSEGRVRLLWDGRFLLHISLDIHDRRGRRVGAVKTEADMARMTHLFEDIASLGQTVEFAVCATAAGMTMDCFLSNRSGKRFFERLSRVVEGKPLPMNFALNGETGVITGKDYRRQEVIAAYAPVGQLPLGMVLKIDRADLYLPVRRMLKFVAPLLAALLAIGVLLLSYLVKPLVSKLVASEAEARGLQVALLRFKNTLDQTLDCVFMFHPETLRFSYANEGAKRQTGYTDDELSQMTPLDIKPEFTPERFRNMLRPLHEGAQPSLTFETVHRHKDGHDIPVEVFLQLIRLEGQAASFVAVVRDIRGRKQEERRLRDLIDGLGPHMLVGLLSVEGVLLEANRAALTAGGLNPEDVLGRPLEETYWLSYSKDVQRQIRDSIVRAARGEASRYDLQIRAADDQFIIIDFCLQPLRDATGKVVFLVPSGIVITERKRAEDRLRDTHQRLVEILETMSDGFVTWDKNWLFTYVNAAAERMMHKSREELLGRNILDLFHPDPDDPSRARYQRAMAERISDSWEMFYAPLNIWVEVRAYPSEDGSLSVIVRDITERKSVEEKIRQLNKELEQRVLERTAELRAANQDLEAFSYSVAHDLRAPLRHIDSFGQALLEDFGDKLDEQAKEYLGRMRGASQRMGALIDDLLTLSRIARSEMRRAPVDLSALAAGVIAELQAGEPARQVDCRVAAGLAAEGDAELLCVALTNLLGNAWKFTGKTAKPLIEFGARTEEDGETVFFVRDNGAGFDMAHAGKMFGAFQRLHPASEFPGTGVGLATVQRIVRRHGGRIWAEGAEGKGAAFYFTLRPGRRTA